MNHPQWCNTEHCTADQPGGVHQSDPTSVADLSLSLSEPAMPGTRAVITLAALVSPDPDNPYDRLFIPAIHANALGTALARMGGLAATPATTPAPVS